MGLFGKSKKKKAPTGPPMDVSWVKSPKGFFYNFLNLDPEDVELSGKTGVFVIWLGGHFPEWLFIGRTGDLAKTFTKFQRDPDILQYDREGRLFVTWSEIKPEFQDGVVKYLNLDPKAVELSGKTGVFVIWLGGHFPEWLFIGRTYNLAGTLTELQRDPEILQYDKEGGLFVTWSEIKPEFQDGVVQYLNQVIPPTIPNPMSPEEDEPPIAVFPPGVQVPPMDGA